MSYHEEILAAIQGHQALEGLITSYCNDRRRAYPRWGFEDRHQITNISFDLKSQRVLCDTKREYTNDEPDIRRISFEIRHLSLPQEALDGIWEHEDWERQEAEAEAEKLDLEAQIKKARAFLAQHGGL